MQAEWYCRVMGSELGPFTSSQLLEMARMHRLSPEDFVRRGLGGAWTAAYRVKGLFDDAAGSVIIKAVLPPEKPKIDSQPKAHLPSDGHVISAASREDVTTKCGWYCISSGQKLGPVSFEELQHLALLGRLHPTDRVWSATLPTKHQAREIKGLVFAAEEVT